MFWYVRLLLGLFRIFLCLRDWEAAAGGVRIGTLRGGDRTGQVRGGQPGRSPAVAAGGCSTRRGGGRRLLARFVVTAGNRRRREVVALGRAGAETMPPMDDQPAAAVERPAEVGRAVVLEEVDRPPVLREFPLPPAPAGGAVVACGYGGICGTDLHLQRGHLPVPTPMVLGHEGFGTVRELGPAPKGDGPRPDVDATGAPLAPGDAVMWASSIACGTCRPCRLHREPTLCENRRTYGVNRSVTDGPALSGSWADHIVLRPGTTVVRAPEGIDPPAAMAFACAGPTVVHALYERRPVRLGESVVVQGSGPVGLAAAALARLSGASRVVVVGGPAERLRQAAAAGIGDVHLNIVEAADAEEAAAVLDEARAAAGPDGADLVIECAGVPAAVAQGLRLARRGGSYLVIGQYTDAGDTLLNPHQIVHRQLDVIGSWAFSGAHLVEYVRLLPALVARFDLAGLVTTFPLREHARATAAVAEGSVMKAVLVS
jgi:threonine dehydrogenase-like Zn-dependent dehydrogenase